MRKILCIILIATFAFIIDAQAQSNTDTTKQVVAKKNWYESVSIRGYSQIRYNRLMETNSLLGCESCDRSWGDGGGVFIRRMRIIFFGKLNDHVSFYVQPDLASNAGTGNLHFAQLRDAYFDVSVDKKGEFRFRIGQSKVPYGFMNLQSSQNRLPLDRDDALNSAVSNERDLGLFFYWAPQKTRKLFSSLVADGLKGSGDYGVFGFGAYNGQTANKADGNKDLHYVTSITYPFQIGNQIIEPGVQAYTGRYVVTKDQQSAGVKTTWNANYDDQRIAAHLVLYPKPFGITAEYTVGKGPEFNTVSDSIETQDLQGGYIMLSYLQKFGKHVLIPFSRIQYYDGGKKHERDARSYKVNEIESGFEWQFTPNFELVATYVVSSRRYEDFAKQTNHQKGRLLRLQAQVNF
nr:porin [Bacteroidota bacterium]